jgi:hypothetical protein
VDSAAAAFMEAEVEVVLAGEGSAAEGLEERAAHEEAWEAVVLEVAEVLGAAWVAVDSGVPEA